MLDWAREKTFSEEEALLVKSESERAGQLVVSNVDNKDTQREKPEALNTVMLLRLASQQIGLGPQAAMHIAEKLYLGGFITYPRTESTRYPKSFDYFGVVRSLATYAHCQGVQNYATKLISFGMDQPKAGKDQGDHPPITPTQKSPHQGFHSRDEANMYELIARHYLASISFNARFFKKKVVFSAGSQRFALKGTACVNAGFLEVLPWIKIHENEIPNFKQGDSL
jgi:DNA topoisomerase-3